MLENWGTWVISLFGVMFILMGGTLAVFILETLEMMKRGNDESKG